MPRAVTQLAMFAALVAGVGTAGSCGRAPQPVAEKDRELAGAIADVEAGRRTTPIIGPPAKDGEAQVTFLAESFDGRVPRVVSDLTGWGENTSDDTFDLTAGTMSRVGQSDWYRLEARVARGARVQYLIVLGETDYRLDPHNPRQTQFPGMDPVSEFVTVGYAPPPEFVTPPAKPAGRTVEATIESRVLGGPRRIAVYLPAENRADRDYPVAVFHDGWGVAHQGEAPRVFDSLIAHRAIEPVVAAFVASHREGDAENREGGPMRTFLNQEVPEWLARRYRVAARPEERAILAVSFGAKDAVDAVFAPGGSYGRVGLLIPGRRLRHADIEALTTRRGRRLQVVILAGRYDAANLVTARDARRHLVAAGHDVDYLEVPEGHNPTTWRNHLRDVLVSLFGPH